MTNITLLYEILQAIKANTLFTGVGTLTAVVALIVAIIAYREAKKDGH
mgnify:CR=1 FL=1